MDLFRPDVYQAMEEHLRGPSRYNGVEEAIKMINADKKLQAFLHDFAVRNAITCRGWGIYGHGDCFNRNTDDKSMVIWQGKGLYDGEEYRPNLSICPDLKSEVMPIFLRFYHSSGDDVFREFLLVEERPDGAFLCLNPYKVQNSPDWEGEVKLWHNRRIVDMGFFEGVASKDILAGLSKAIAEIVGLKQAGKDWRD